MRATLAAAVLVLPASVHPWPVGPGPRYLPPARPGAVATGAPVDGLRCTRAVSSFRVHVELFADRKVVIVPAGIGVAEPYRREGAAVRPAGCTYPVWTVAPDGVVEVARGRQLSLADFRSSAPLRAYVAGRRVRGPAGAIPLTPGAEIVVELGAYVPPHPSFLFAPGARS